MQVALYTNGKGGAYSFASPNLTLVGYIEAARGWTSGSGPSLTEVLLAQGYDPYNNTEWLRYWRDHMGGDAWTVELEGTP